LNAARPDPLRADAPGENVRGAESCCARREEKLKADS
jgi:hypothetical protein